MSTPRYVVAGWWEAKATDFLAKTVHEEERQPVFTGILDSNGIKIFRVEDRRPAGFITHLKAAE